MNHKQRRFHINSVLNAAKSVQCKDLHHKKSHQHELGEVCMAEYELNKSIHIVEQILENATIQTTTPLETGGKTD